MAVSLAGLGASSFMSGKRAPNGADGRIQDTTEHLHDRACTHESSNVQGV